MPYVLAVNRTSGREGVREQALPSRPISSVFVTAGSTLVMGGAAAATGIVLARKFGRSAEMDGFLAAYAVYLAFALTAQTIRIVLVPELTRAARASRLVHETRSYASAVLIVAVSATAVVAATSHPIGRALTGGLPPVASATAGKALVWLVPAGFAQVLAALLAAALAARGSYVVAAMGFAAGALSALLVFLVLVGAHGPLSLAWGIAAGSAVSLSLPVAALGSQGLFQDRHRPTGQVARLGRLAQIVALPLALQGCYVIALRLAADLRIGDVTSLSYAYIFAATVVAATASALALVSSAPLTRRGIDGASAASHLIHTVWLSLAVVAAAAAVFALVGGRITHLLLGSAFGGAAGHQLGRMVVFLAPWMVASVAFSVTLPLLFVAERRGILPLIAGGTLVLHLAVSIGLRSALGVDGLALALGISTTAVLALLLATVVQRQLAQVAVGLTVSTLGVALLTLLTFGVCALFLPETAAAALGLVLYALVLITIRPRPLREAWAYVRALH
jgi:peptidoglycan biosynthesis protein MviN/MurJ (putative lipid II flippase)